MQLAQNQGPMAGFSEHGDELFLITLISTSERNVLHLAVRHYVIVTASGNTEFCISVCLSVCY
jgi:hypothetical protein